MEIYLIKNLVNGKVYIGQTTRGAFLRWEEHLYDALKGGHYHLHSAIRKYGQQSFQFLVLAVCDSIEELNKLEVEYIKQYNSNDADCGYNCNSGGKNGGKLRPDIVEKISKSHTGKKHPWQTSISESHKEALRIAWKTRVPTEADLALLRRNSGAMRGKPLTAEHKQKLSTAFTGRVVSFETRQRMSEARKLIKCYPPSTEVRAKLSVAFMGRYVSGETKQRMRDAWVLRKARAQNG